MALYRIADLLVSMDTWGKTERQARIYRVEEQAEPDVILPEAERQAQMHRLEERVEGNDNAELTRRVLDELQPDGMEYMLTGHQFYTSLMHYSGLMLHASSVMMDGKAYLFSAHSGTGKSTHTKLWTKVFGENRAQIFNDDKPALRLVDGQWYAYGTPWTGKCPTSLNVRVPIGGICFIRRGDTNSIKPMPASQAIFEILGQTVRTRDPRYRNKLLESIAHLVDHVSVYEMHCNMEPEAALLSYGVMSGEHSADEV